jgi:dihydrofolate synthase/folylpolyglutamate synthase
VAASGVLSEAGWSEARAERHLASLEAFGMRFGLQRMSALMDVLEEPQRRFDAIQVLGTNGKTSTTRMISAILERHGLRTASYTSPHLIGYRERVEVSETALEPSRFGAAVQRAAWAADEIEHTLADDERVTQFELLTAAAFDAIAQSGAQVATIEAGLGGRYDATSVVSPSVTVLTNVALEHTRWLGGTVAEIAEEKLAVVARGGVLVVGAGLAPRALAVAERVAGERGARLIIADASRPVPPLRARGSFQIENFALARSAAEAYLEQVRPGSTPGPTHEQALRGAAASTQIAGRLQSIAPEPATIVDAAHNPAAVEALVRALPEVFGDAPLALVFGVLDDKDAAAMLATLRGSFERAWLTAPASPRALPVAKLEEIAREAGLHETTCEPDSARALEAARTWAHSRGGAVLATGSVYLVGELLSAAGSGAAARDAEAPPGRPVARNAGTASGGPEARGAEAPPRSAAA